MTTSLADALYREVRPEFFRVLAGAKSGRLYVEALDRLESAAAHQLQGIDRDYALSLVEEAVEAHAEAPLDDVDPASSTLSTRDKARAVLETLRRAGWVEEEQRADWQKLIHFHPSGQTMMQALRRTAFPEGLVFSDKLVSVCTTFSWFDEGQEPGHTGGPWQNVEGSVAALNDALREEPWQHVESSVAALQDGIAELRSMQSAIEHHTRQQLAAVTLKENLAVLFDKFAERIGRACYAELVRSRLPMRLAEARRRVEELAYDPDLLVKMQAEVLRREPTLTPEEASQRVRTRLEELTDLLQSVVPVADAVDRRTAEFTRRSLARFRYLQETTSEQRQHVQDFFETLNRQFAGRRLNAMEDAGLGLPDLKLHDARLLAGLESLYTPRLRREAAEIAPLDDAATEDEQDDALRRLQSAMRDSMTVARANRFVEEILPESGASMRSDEIPLRCDDDIADLIATLLHARTSEARYRVEVSRETVDAHRGEYDLKLNYRIERFTLHRK